MGKGRSWAVSSEIAARRMKEIVDGKFMETGNGITLEQSLRVRHMRGLLGKVETEPPEKANPNQAINVGPRTGNAVRAMNSHSRNPDGGSCGIFAMGVSGFPNRTLAIERYPVGSSV